MVDFVTGLINFGIEYFWLMVDVIWFLITSPFFQGFLAGSIMIWFSIVTDIMENHRIDYFEAIKVIDGRNTIIKLGDYNEVR